MSYQFPSRKEIKADAKGRMMHPIALRATLFVVCMALAFFGIRMVTNANLTYAIADLNQYQDTATGIYFNDNGLSILFRMDLTEMVLAIPLSYQQLTAFLVVGGLSFLLLAPFRMGGMEVYWSVLRDGSPTMASFLAWGKKPGLFAKAFVVEFVLRVVIRVIGMVCTIPSLYLYYIFYTNVTTIDQLTSQMSTLQGLASLLALAAGVFCFWLHCAFLPVRYCLAAHPEYTLGQAFSRGLASMKGCRNRFFWFRLTMVPWFFASQVTYGVLDLFVLPYTTMASMRYVQECAKERAAKAGNQPELTIQEP